VLERAQPGPSTILPARGCAGYLPDPVLPGDRLLSLPYFHPGGGGPAALLPSGRPAALWLVLNKAGPTDPLDLRAFGRWSAPHAAGPVRAPDLVCLPPSHVVGVPC